MKLCEQSQTTRGNVLPKPTCTIIVSIEGIISFMFAEISFRHATTTQMNFPTTRAHICCVASIWIVQFAMHCVATLFPINQLDQG